MTQSTRTQLLSLLLLACASCSTITPTTAIVTPQQRLGPAPLSAEQLQNLNGVEGFASGVAEAESVIRTGKIVFRTYGLDATPTPSAKDRRYSLVLARYNVSYKSMGCELPPSSEPIGFQHRMVLEVINRYGADFWERVAREADNEP